MQIISGTTDFYIEEPTAVVLGKFDGVHIGHQLLISKLLEQKEKGLKTVVFTFDKSPASLFIQDGDAYRELCSLEEKRNIFEGTEVDVFVEFPMNTDTASIPAELFVTEILQNRLNCNMLIAGEDITFGHRGMGDSRMLLQYSEKGAFEVEIVEKLLISDIFPEEESGIEVSSTVIRKEIAAGNIVRANAMMGRAFQVSGEVIHGNHMGGKVFDLPTANILWPDDKILPAFGVYFTEIYVDGTAYAGITNIGIKPTIAEKEQTGVLAESFIYDFDGDLYGKNITIIFYSYERPEQKFENFEQLKNQLLKDKKAGKVYWSMR